MEFDGTGVRAGVTPAEGGRNILSIVGHGIMSSSFFSDKYRQLSEKRVERYVIPNSDLPDAEGTSFESCYSWFHSHVASSQPDAAQDPNGTVYRLE